VMLLTGGTPTLNPHHTAPRMYRRSRPVVLSLVSSSKRKWPINGHVRSSVRERILPVFSMPHCNASASLMRIAGFLIAAGAGAMAVKELTHRIFLSNQIGRHPRPALKLDATLVTAAVARLT